MKREEGRNKGFDMEDESSISLRQIMTNEELIPSLNDEYKRKSVINKLQRLVMSWSKKVAWLHNLPQHQIDSTNATVLAFGSYGLGVHGSESDIDVLCIVPFFVSIAEDFFIVLRDMLKNRTGVSEVRCVKDAKIPLIRFKFDGFLVDLPYAQLRVFSIPNDIDVLNPFFLRDIDETSWKSLSGARANKFLLQIVPSIETFQSLLRCVKLWAKRRGVYGHLNGFLGGIHMAILAAFVCGYEPNGTLSSLMASFFNTFAYWQWPTPVVLLEETYPATKSPPGLMPIQLPCGGAHQYCYSNKTRSTFYKIMVEFLRGQNLTKDYMKPNFSWKTLFEPYPYADTYTWFVKIHLSATNQEDLDDWTGWVKSRFRFLLIKIEEVYGLCDPNPTVYVEPYAKEPNTVFYWGIQLRSINVSDIESIETDFLKNLNSSSFQGAVGKVQLSIVQASELPKNDDFNSRSKKVKSELPKNDDCESSSNRSKKVKSELLKNDDCVSTSNGCKKVKSELLKNDDCESRSKKVTYSELPKNDDCVSSSNRSKKVTDSELPKNDDCDSSNRSKNVTSELPKNDDCESRSKKVTSELLKNDDYDRSSNRSKKVTRTCWRIREDKKVTSELLSNNDDCVSSSKRSKKVKSELLKNDDCESRSKKVTSELPKNDECESSSKRSKKVTRTSWRIREDKKVTPNNDACDSSSSKRSKKVIRTCWRIREDRRCKNVPVYVVE